jgi:hypothetical protein
VDDIVGVEVYEAGSIPSEWRLSIVSVEEQSVGMVAANGKPPVRIGHTGMPPLPSARDMRLPLPPRCAFMQIWTRVAW